ncbi:MAG: His/Gly/Thr/Pro-type tRNA ligase C-terminal domain-containing protein [Candidatus Moranbacteria bacterium]|nr:His/Gly/Thr/Pro-type tRNA ligase C-terminal domain-containing protein [Candidatus Moranbacteria bacterium]
MKQSQFFSKTQKNAPAGEVSVNAQFLTRGGFVDKLMAGVYTILPLGLRVMKKIEQIIREEIDAIGGQEFEMPALHPKENWEKTGRWSKMDDLYKVKDASGREFALGPTHEEVIAPLMKKFVSSYKDLPFAAYQFQTKFRMELRAKSGILRGREFLMKDLYSFHIAEKDLDAYYEKAKKAYFKIFERAGLKEKTYLAFASGGSFSKYSHEFQTVTAAGEDTIYICEKCQNAVNKEIKSETPVCPVCGGKKFKEEKAIEVGNIFKLMDKFTKPFDLKVMDADGKEKMLVMGCYGIGLSRLMGTIVEVHHDEKGIIWPESVAPFGVHLISLGKDKEAEEIYKNLLAKNIEVLFDDRDVSAGEKFADADLIGIPWRVLVSEKSLAAGGVEVKKRKEKTGKVVSKKEIADLIH